MNRSFPSFCFTSAGLFLFFPILQRSGIMPRNHRNCDYKKLVSWSSRNKLSACKNIHYAHVWRTYAPKYSQSYTNCGTCDTRTFLCLCAEHARGWRLIKKAPNRICKESPRTTEGNGTEWVTPELLSFSSFACFTNMWWIKEWKEVILMSLFEEMLLSDHRLPGEKQDATNTHDQNTVLSKHKTIATVRCVSHSLGWELENPNQLSQFLYVILTIL